MEWLKNNYVGLIAIVNALVAIVLYIVHFVLKHSKTKEEKVIERKEREAKKDLARVEKLQKAIDTLKTKHAGGK